MHIVIISTVIVGITTPLVTPLVTAFGMYYFKKDVLDFYDKNIKYKISFW